MPISYASKMSIESPAFSVTIAFFQCGRRPTTCPTRRSFPRWFEVQTPVTVTLKSSSIAFLMWIFVAFGCTRNVYSPRSWYADEVCSVTIGVMIVRVSVGIAYFPFFLPADFLADFFFAVLAAAFGLADLPAALAAFLAALCVLELLAAAFAVLRSAFSVPRDLVSAFGLAARGFSSTAASS